MDRGYLACIVISHSLAASSIINVCSSSLEEYQAIHHALWPFSEGEKPVQRDWREQQSVAGADTREGAYGDTFRSCDSIV